MLLMYEEGKVRIVSYKGSFLNPVARASREISIALAKSIYKGGKVLDATAATGIRGMEYAAELGAEVTMLEINSTAYKDLRRNLLYNAKAHRLGKGRAKAINTSFQEFANTTSERFEIIDIDPFGSAAPYIFDSMKIASDSSYLFVTATDAAVLCGAHRKACMKLYDAVPMHNEFCHEAGIRILLGYIARTAAQFNYGIVPVLSLYYAHYMRVFVRLEHGAKAALDSLASLGYAYYCEKCGNRNHEKSEFAREERCDLCGAKMTIAGRMWLGSITDKKAVSSALEHMEGASKEARGLMNRIAEELDVPFYYSVPELTKKLGMGSISISALIEALRKIGRVSKTHFDYSSIRTDVPYKDIILQAKRLGRERKIGGRRKQ